MTDPGPDTDLDALDAVTDPAPAPDVEGPVELGVMGDWIAAGHHDPAGCGATTDEPGNCGQPRVAEVHEAPSCGCGGDHWTCTWPDDEDEEAPAPAAEQARAERLTWSPGDLLISPPPASICGAWYGAGDGTSAECVRPAGHPPVSQDGIGHADAARLQAL